MDKELAFNEIYEKYSKRVEGYLIYKINNKSYVDDIFQSVFLVVFKNIDSLLAFNEASRERYIFAMARRKAIDHFRFKKKDELRFPSFQTLCVGINKRDRDISDVLSTMSRNYIADSDYEDEMEINKKAMHDALNRMKPVYKDILFDFYVSGLSVKEIQANKGIPIGTITSNLARGRKILTSLVEKYKR